MTPEDHGYMKCVRCGTWRPKGEVVRFDMNTPGATGQPPCFRPACADTAWCSQQAAVGKGEMDGVS